MGFIDNLLGKKDSITMYTSDTCFDCQEAKSFFAEHQIDVEYKNVSEKENREELRNKYKRMAVPTIIIGDRVILSFAENRAEIMKLLKL